MGLHGSLSYKSLRDGEPIDITIFRRAFKKKRAGIRFIQNENWTNLTRQGHFYRGIRQLSTLETM